MTVTLTRRGPGPHHPCSFQTESHRVLTQLLLSPRLALGAVLALAGLTLFAADPHWVTAAGLDVWNAPALQREYEEGVERSRGLDADGDKILCRIEVKEALVQQLIDGRITLAEVSARFLAMNRTYADQMQTLRHAYPDITDAERSARNVVTFVQARMNGLPPARKAEVALRVAGEFHGLDFEPAPAGE